MVQQELERYRSDAGYFDEHREQWLREHPDRWVAVYNRQFVGAAKDIKRLITQLERKGIPPAQVYVEYLTEKEELLILASSRR
jgi:hypothetical protein